jgi:telomerase reverse transcriptase
LQIVDFVIWSLFHRSSTVLPRPNHVLCYGYQKVPLRGSQSQADTIPDGIPGVTSLQANESVRKLKCKPWTEILPLLGSSGHAVLRNLLLDCGIFVRIDQGNDNLHQICGIPVSELLKDRKTLDPYSKISRMAPVGKRKKDSCDPRKPASITFVRSRTFYARPSVNAQGDVRFGLKHIHVLNRCSDLSDCSQLIHIMKHIFPRQWGLHNVFTSVVDKSETAQEFKDYTLREYEIKFVEHQAGRQSGAHAGVKDAKIPKRLRGEPLLMVQEIRKRHSKCSYSQLLRHHCPVQSKEMRHSTFPVAAESPQSSGCVKTQLSSSRSTLPQFSEGQDTLEAAKAGGSILAYATPTAQVSAFCRAVVGKLFPGNALGVGASGEHNMTVLLAQVDKFVRVRRHESLSLHEALQSLSIHCISWLCPPRMSQKAKLSRPDRTKRQELLLELLYYIFDSILIPLIRSHFYVTESNVHRNRLFYFRHDVWRTVSEPSLADLRCTVFQGFSARDFGHARNSRLLGHSQVRLLPKESGARPIINLRRKMIKNQNGRRILSHNINSKLMPCFATLNYEKCLQPQKLGSALFSVGEAHQRLRDFRSTVNESMKELYFVKMDVQSCFDTIPQDGVMHTIQGLLSERRYQIGKHAELKSVEGMRHTSSLERPLVRFPHIVRPSGTSSGLSGSLLSHLAQKRNRTVFVDLWDSRSWEARSVLKLLQEHIQENVVKIGKRLFRQRRGIPQGSVLSSLLCNLFYGAFENSCLGFLRPGESLLLRLIDDFLLVTTNQDHARRFAQVMVDGNPQYGIAVNPHKSLANFGINVNGTRIPRLHGSDMFPYCGVSINVHTLEIGKFREGKDAEVSNGLTVEFNRRQGLRFHRKVLDSLKIQMTAMLLDTNLSSRSRVASNLYQNFMEAAMKMYRYVRSLPKARRPSETMIMETWKDLVDLAVNMTQGKRSSSVIDMYECAISKTQLHWLAAAALEHVMRKKQTGYRCILRWAQETMHKCQAGMKMDLRRLADLRDEGDRVFHRYHY